MAARKTSTRKKSSAKKPVAKKTAATSVGTSMAAGQRAIYNKLRKKGMSDKQAAAFSKHAAKRKAGAAKTSTAKKGR